MSKLNYHLQGDMDAWADRITEGILSGSISASLEDRTDLYGERGARCCILVFERYSYLGGNRLTMSVTLFQDGGDIQLTANTSGGSQAVFLKINTWGEDAFLEKLDEILK